MRPPPAFFLALWIPLLSLAIPPGVFCDRSCSEPEFLRINDAPHAFDFAVPSGDAGGYYIDALKRSGIMVPVASSIMADALRSLCKARQPRGLFVDVGAHVGWFSAMAASHGCDVVAIEPQDRAISCIQATVAANSARWQNVSVSVVHAAAGRESGFAALSDSATSPDWALASVVFGDANQSLSPSTKVLRIDDAVREAFGQGALSRVVALKVDVEGAEVDALEGAPHSITSASLVFLEVKRDGLSATAAAEKSRVLAELFPHNTWSNHEFFEEIGRKLSPPWGLQWHILPINKRQGWSSWPHDRQFDDHVLLRRGVGQISLTLPGEPRVAFEFPPPEFVFPIMEKSGLLEKGLGSLSGTIGVAVYSPHGITSDHSLSLFIDGVAAMTSPLRANTDGDSYTRMTVSLDGWGVEIGSSSLFLECSLMVDEQEGAVFARTRARYLVASTGAVSIRATSQVSELQMRDVRSSLWFREIYGGQHAFGQASTASA